MFTRMDMLIIAWMATKLMVDGIAFVYIIWRLGNIR